MYGVKRRKAYSITNEKLANNFKYKRSFLTQKVDCENFFRKIAFECLTCVHQCLMRDSSEIVSVKMCQQRSDTSPFEESTLTLIGESRRKTN